MANLYKLKNNNKLFDIKKIPYWCSVFTSTPFCFLFFYLLNPDPRILRADPDPGGLT